ncbi:MAG: 2-hydroxyacyl-CoA dehydratase [Chloroflexi bacterium]|nr:2-hydroxyacyl-CoA dehydratase [Chloroflexota bacterium]
MNVFEAEIAKYERRLEKIERNPNPNMAASNKLLYQVQLEDNREHLRAWREGKDFVGVATGGMLMRCFGDFGRLNLVRIADRLATGRAEQCVDMVGALGLPDYACDRTVLFLPLATAGDDLPKPRIIVSRTGACEVVNDTHRTLAHLLGVPVFTVDIPLGDPDQENLAYVVKQLEALIEFVETHLPGARFNESKLREYQELGRRWRAALHDIGEMRKLIPCPEHPRDVFREPLFPEEFTNSPLIVKYYEDFRDELRGRVARRWSPVGEERLRIVWAITGPYGSNIWDYLAKRGVAVPFWHYGGSKRNFLGPNFGDTEEYGRKLSPLEEEARMWMYNSWGGGGERWIGDTINACREFRADGLVLFEQTGCLPVVGLGHVIAGRLEQQMHIPVWRIEGRQLLGRSEGVEAQFMAGLEEFVDLCFQRKEAALLRSQPS